VLIDCRENAMLTVCDNGAGFETAAVGTASHGLAGMRHRVGACAGQLTVSFRSRVRNATVVAVRPGQSAGEAPLAGTRFGGAPCRTLASRWSA
jgi:glucose-6-phosphate-specific signal transduction histidine kinase